MCGSYRSPQTCLEPPIGVLKEKSDATIVYMLATAELPWLYCQPRRQGRIVERPGEREIARLASLTVGLHKIARIL